MHHHTDIYTFRVAQKACKYIGAPSCVCPPTTHRIPLVSHTRIVFFLQDLEVAGLARQVGDVRDGHHDVKFSVLCFSRTVTLTAMNPVMRIVQRISNIIGPLCIII